MSNRVALRHDEFIIGRKGKPSLDLQQYDDISVVSPRVFLDVLDRRSV